MYPSPSSALTSHPMGHLNVSDIPGPTLPRNRASPVTRQGRHLGQTPRGEKETSSDFISPTCPSPSSAQASLPRAIPKTLAKSQEDKSLTFFYIPGPTLPRNRDPPSHLERTVSGRDTEKQRRQAQTSPLNVSPQFRPILPTKAQSPLKVSNYPRP